MKSILSFCLFFFSFSIVSNTTNSLRITLDPGHDNRSLGACYEYDGQMICEYKLNSIIAENLKEILEKNYVDKSGHRVKVFLTKTDSSAPNLSQRVMTAKENFSDVLISLHFNAGLKPNYKGAMVLVTSQKNYLPKYAKFTKIYDIEDRLAGNILEELNKIGIQTFTGYFKCSEKFPEIFVHNGRLRRLSEDNTLYPNGELADYYGIIRHGILNNIPSIIVEHAFLASKDDYESFLSTDAKLKQLAWADAKGIAKFYGLKKLI